MQIQVTPREPNTFETVLGETVGIKSVGSRLNNPSSQHLALRDLGVRITDTTLSISFKESGFSYLDPFGDRNLLESQKSTQSFTLNFSLPLEPLYPLSVAVSFDPFCEDCVNYLGNVTVNTPNGEKRMLPLTGRGTAALDGKKNDAHAGFATGGAGASFQNRCCFILAIAASAGAGMNALHQIGQEFLKIDEKFHGRSDCLRYAIYCSQTPLRDRISYTNYLQQLYPKNRWSPVLSSVVENSCLPQCYYNAVLQKLSPSEFEEDRQRCSQMEHREMLFSPEDGVKMLCAKEVTNVLTVPNKWILPAGKFTVEPEVGDALVSPRARITPLGKILQNLGSSNEMNQSDLLLDLGLEIEGHQLLITVHETGYSLTGTPDSEGIQSASLTLNFPNDLCLPLQMKFVAKSFIQDGVNYFGGLKVLNEFFLPLVGRGTVNLEQLPITLEQALPVVSGKRASFLTKSAVIMAICKCLEASPYQLEQVKEMLCSIDFKTYKQPEMILYYHECLKYVHEKMPSFTAFLSTIYEEKAWSENLKHLLKFGYPHETYFSALKIVLTPQEHSKCLERHQTALAKSSKARHSHLMNGGSEKTDIPIAFFPYRARFGNSYRCSTSNEKIPVEEALHNLSSDNLEQQIELLDMVVKDGHLEITFIEIGNPYVDQSGDRSKTLSDISCQVCIKMPLLTKPPKALKLSALLDPYDEEGVNYLGKLHVENQQGESRIIPLVGRGTIALEGHESGDTHAGLATGGACATFQNRAAAIVGVVFALDLDDGALKQIYYTLCYVNSCYHGRKSSLDYIMYCVSTSDKNRKSYYRYMLESSKESELNCLMISLRDKHEICETTLARVKSKLTAEEQHEDLVSLDTGLQELELPPSYNDNDDDDVISSSEQVASRKISRPLGADSNEIEDDDENRRVRFNLETEVHVVSLDMEPGREREKDVPTLAAPEDTTLGEPAKTSKSVVVTNSCTEGKANASALSEKHTQLLQSISHHLNPTTIKVKPRVGSPFTNFLGGSFSIYDVITTFRDHQSQGLSMLGISVDKSSRTFNLVFREDGRPYAEPSGNRTKLGPETVTEKYYSCRLANPPPQKLDLLISLVPYDHDGVNYFGRVTFNSPLNEYRVVPLVGRGTVALEARDQDAKCTPCITGHAATFQQRIALCFATLAAAGGTAQDLDELSVALKPINDIYHGRDDLFLYTLQCAKKPASSVPSYLKFMSLTNREGERSPMLRSMIGRGLPAEEYYAQLVDVLSRDELMQDRI